VENSNFKGEVRELSREEIDLVAGGTIAGDLLAAGKSILMAVIGPFVGGNQPPMPVNPFPFPVGPATGAGPRGGNCPGPCHGHRPA